MNVLKSTFRVQKTVGKGILVPALIDGCTLDLQWSFFKLTMKHNAAYVMVERNDVNPITCLWLKVAASSIILSVKLNEYLKLAELATVQILGSVEDERTFSNLTFMKSKLRN